jgi:hypothetical protein
MTDRLTIHPTLLTDIQTNILGFVRFIGAIGGSGSPAAALSKPFMTGSIRGLAKIGIFS